ncbi:MAG: ribbon-helix-helix protein, CopG family [Spirochaetaceae bacterium]|nr:MAG: ribbon-helix-helix protein, CopG family [Spirochaetaceae bacterium]
MRTIIEIPDSYVQRLDELKQQRRVSRSELIREAVERYLESAAGSVEDTAFGVWAEQGARREDGVTYQQRLRSEWDS